MKRVIWNPLENAHKRYYSVDETGNKIIKEFDLLEWVVKEIESRKFILKEDFIDELASHEIDVFTYNQEDYNRGSGWE